MPISPQHASYNICKYEMQLDISQEETYTNNKDPLENFKSQGCIGNIHSRSHAHMKVKDHKNSLTINNKYNTQFFNQIVCYNHK